MQAACASGAVTYRGGRREEERWDRSVLGQEQAAAAASDKACSPGRMDKSPLRQLLPGSQVFTVNGAEEGAPEKPPGALEATGDVGSTPPSGEAARSAQV